MTRLLIGFQMQGRGSRSSRLLRRRLGDAERRADARAAAAEKAAATTRRKYQKERARNRFLVAASSLDQDTILNLHHQIIIHASDVHVGVRRMMGQLRKRVHVRKDDWIDFLELISFRNSQIMTASKFATKGGYRSRLRPSKLISWSTSSTMLRRYLQCGHRWALRSEHTAMDGKQSGSFDRST